MDTPPESISAVTIVDGGFRVTLGYGNVAIGATFGCNGYHLSFTRIEPQPVNTPIAPDGVDGALLIYPEPDLTLDFSSYRDLGVLKRFVDDLWARALSDRIEGGLNGTRHPTHAQLAVDRQRAI